MKASALERKHARKPAKNEHCLQRAIVNWCDGLGKNLVRGRFFAIPNGGARDPITGARLKAEGVRAGAPDLVFWRQKGRVLWMEVKNGTSGSVSAAQRKLHDSLKADCHVVVICRCLKSAIAAIYTFYQTEDERK